MRSIIFVMVSVITFTSLMLFEVLIVIKKSETSKKVERIFEHIQYMIFLLIPVACFAIVLQYIKINTFICAVIWIVLLEGSNRMISSIILKNVNLEIKVAMSLLAMILSMIYFGTKALLEWSVDYLGMMSIIAALILGFFVPLDVLLTNASLCDKAKKILKATKLKKVNKEKWVVFLLTVIYFIVCAFLDKIKICKEYVISMYWGLIVGVGVSLPFIGFISRKKANALKDCYDTRQTIFKSESFIRYRRKIEEFLNYSEEEKYDYVEAFLFCNAFVSVCDKSEQYKVGSMLSVCEHMRQEYSCCSEMVISQRYPYNDNIFVLKKGKRKFCGAIMTSPWSLFEEYLRAYSGIVLEKGDVPKKERERYAAAGFAGKMEMWLLYFLEKYHGLSYKKREKMIPKEVRSFLIDSYREEAMWLIPVACNAVNMRKFEGPSKIEEKYDFGDLALKAIYEWYNLRSNDSESATKQIRDYFGNNQDILAACEEWLGEFSDWTDFVISNKIQKFVKKRKNIFIEKYEEPIMYFEEHSIYNMLPDSQKEWLKMFKKISSMIYRRY